MTSSESESASTRPRKRSRTSNTAEDGGKDGKKARGRPRVDTQDATAADVSSWLAPYACNMRVSLGPSQHEVVHASPDGDEFLASITCEANDDVATQDTNSSRPASV